jgi:branched-chain amino acid transport system permease protein
MSRNLTERAAGGGARASIQRLVVAAVVVTLVSVLVGEDAFWIRVASIAAITYIVAGSYNLIFGYAGLFALAHVALYGVGAYASVILIDKHGVPFLAAGACSILLTCAMSWILWLLTQRLSDVFFAVGTLAFGIAIGEVLNSWVDLTGGPTGYLGIVPLSVGGIEIFGGSFEYMWLCLVVAVICFEVMFRASQSPAGQFFVALREDETLLRSIAVRPETVRRNAFVLSAFFAGLAGVLYAHMTMFISPESFSLHVMVSVLVITLSSVTSWAMPTPFSSGS